MKEFVDVRLSEEWAQAHLDQTWGQPMPLGPQGSPSALFAQKVPLSLMTRQLVIETSDPKIAVLKEKMFTFPPGAMTAMDFRKYQASELSDASLLHLIITEFIDACGEDYDTVYDESGACARCGFGRKQMSPLRLDLGKTPKDADFATTIARGEELLISESVAKIIREGSITGCGLDPVEDARRPSEQGRWYQLVITAKAGETVPPTRFAKDFFREDISHEFVCPQHRLSGLNLVSEVFLSQRSMETADILKTTNRYGNRAGWVQPSAIVLINQRFYRLLKAHSLQGYKVEVAHLLT